MNFNDAHSHVRDGLINFDPSCHVYTFGDEVFESVTTVVENCFAKFDAETWARKKRPQDPESLLAEWEAKGKEARELGTLMHDRIERHYLGEAIDSEAFTDPTFKRFLAFDKEYQLKPYRSEWRIYSEDYKIAGTLDFLAVDERGQFNIFDWKRSTKVVDCWGNVIDNSFRRTAEVPLQFLADTTFNHYALQVSIYRFILAAHYGIRVNRAFLGVFHPEMPSHYCVELPYLRREVETLLNYRINHK